MTDAASRPIHEPSTGSTIGAAVAAIIAFPFVLMILAVACTLVVTIVMMVLGIEAPSTEQAEAWAQDAGTTYFKLGMTLLQAFTSLIVLFLVFRLFRRANKKRVIIFFGLGMLVLTVLLILSGGLVAARWGLNGVVIACMVSS